MIRNEYIRDKVGVRLRTHHLPQYPTCGIRPVRCCRKQNKYAIVLI